MEVVKVKSDVPPSETKYDKYRIEDRFYFVYQNEGIFTITDAMGRILTKFEKRPSKRELLRVHKCLIEYQSNFGLEDNKTILEDAFSNLQEINSSLKEAHFKLHYSGIHYFELFNEMHKFQQSFDQLLSTFRKLNKKIIKEIEKHQKPTDEVAAEIEAACS